MNIIQAINDPKLFRPFLGDDLDSWSQWMVALRTLYGLPVSKADKGLVKLCTGRKRKSLPDDGFDTGLFLCGRRSGKSRIAATVGAFEACLAGREQRLAPGETGVVAIVSPTKTQSKVVRDYLESLFDTPLLKNEVRRSIREGFDLRNGISIRVLPGDFRSVRSFTLCAVIADEICFFGLEAENKIRSDTELVRALKPGLATTGGKLIAISSPHARRGWAYKQHKRAFGNNQSSTLVWNAASRVMNPTLKQKVVDEALLEDPSAARSEYMAQFRDDIDQYVSRTTVESFVISGRKELLPDRSQRYRAFCDLSGGRRDDATLAIAHRSNKKIVVDFMKRWKPPFSPVQVIAQMSNELRRFRITRVSGDAYAGAFVEEAFKSNRIHYAKSSRNKSELYLEFLPRLNSGEVELLDDDTLVDQLAALERRTRSGGRDLIDHPAGGRDDVANSVAGVVAEAAFNHYRVSIS